MAPDKKDKKRKAAPATVDSPAKKTKSVEAKAAEPAKETPKSILKKSKSNAAPEGIKASPKTKANGDAPRPIRPRKRAADFLSDDDESEAEVEVPDKKVTAEKDTKRKPSTKKSKKEDGTAAPVTEKSAKSSKKAKVLEIVPSDSEDEGVPLNAEESEEEEDYQTAALIRGFESSGDEDESADEAVDPDAPVPKIPDSKKAKRKILKLQKQHKAEATEEPGTVYVGRIPHGFYEHQMRSYFSQFGEITRLRLSRNRLTGRSKHYAFIEFASESVAKIVAATMDNYLMYGHILKCKYVSSQQLHPELWKGANRRFKRTPWNRIEQKRLNKGKSREKWAKNIEQEQKRRLAKAEKLKELGYEFEMPELKSVDDVPVQKAVEGEEAETIEGEQAKAIEAPAPVEAPAEPETGDVDDAPKKSKKEKKDKKEKKVKKDQKVEAVAEPSEVKEAAVSATKSKKKSKARATA
ncbi:uncharacterized protein BJX67DRAFT_364761 [Aspergillus lucknowensis]|uniref:RRM domain-containing protein n=1 Tax=Aspergillus lucknowensis TaxID=176173 RepID=A0ABR4LEX9_9EURO